MPFTFTPRAARVLHRIVNEKGGGLALRIAITAGHTGKQIWSMRLEPRAVDALDVGGIAVHADERTLLLLEGIRVDWVVTDRGEGFGIFQTGLYSQEKRSSG
jgi:Fe-S cluster assembly iron-binding protein IscA